MLELIRSASYQEAIGGMLAATSIIALFVFHVVEGIQDLMRYIRRYNYLNYGDEFENVL